MTSHQTEARPHFPRAEEVREHARRSREEFRRSLTALLPSLPEGFTTHQRAARKEMLLAIRSLIDSAIDRVDQPRP